MGNLINFLQRLKSLTSSFQVRRSFTRLHALSQRADVSDLLSVDDLVAVDEGQVGFGRHKRLTAETLKVLRAFLRDQVLQGQRSRDRSAGNANNTHLIT